MSSTALIAAVLSSLLASPDRGAPEGHLYAALMSAGVSLLTFGVLVEGLEAGGLVTRRGHYITLTAKGADLAAQCDALLARNAEGVRS